MRANKRVRFDEEQASSKKQKEHDSITPPTLENAPKPVRDGGGKYSWNYDPSGWEDLLRSASKAVEDKGLMTAKGDEVQKEQSDEDKSLMTASTLFAFIIFSYKELRLNFNEASTIVEYQALWANCMFWGDDMRIAQMMSNDSPEFRSASKASVVLPSLQQVSDRIMAAEIRKIFSNPDLIRNQALFNQTVDTVATQRMFAGPLPFSRTISSMVKEWNHDDLWRSDIKVQQYMPYIIQGIAAIAPKIYGERFTGAYASGASFYLAYLAWGGKMPRILADFGNLSYMVAFQTLTTPTWITQSMLKAEAMHLSFQQFHQMVPEATSCLAVRAGIIGWARLARAAGSEMTLMDAMVRPTIWAGKMGTLVAWQGAKMLAKGIGKLMSGERYLTNNEGAEERAQDMAVDERVANLVDKGEMDASASDSALEEAAENAAPAEDMDDDTAEQPTEEPSTEPSTEPWEEEEEKGDESDGEPSYSDLEEEEEEEEKGEEPDGKTNEGREATEPTEPSTENTTQPSTETTDPAGKGRGAAALDNINKGLMITAMIDASWSVWAPNTAPEARKAMETGLHKTGKAMLWGQGVYEGGKLLYGLGTAATAAEAGGAVMGTVAAAGGAAVGMAGIAGFALLNQNMNRYFTEQYSSSAHPDFNSDKYYKGLYKGITKDYSKKTGFDYYNSGVGTTLSKERKGETEDALSVIGESTATGATVGMTFAGVGTMAGAAGGFIAGSSIAAGKEVAELLRHGSQDTTSKAYKRHLHKAVEQNVNQMGREFMTDNGLPSGLWDSYWQEDNQTMTDILDYGISDTAIYNMYVLTTSNAWMAGRQYVAYSATMQQSGMATPSPDAWESGQSASFLSWMTDSSVDSSSDYIGGANCSWESPDYYTSRADDGSVTMQMQALPMLSSDGLGFSMTVPSSITIQEYYVYCAAENMANDSMGDSGHMSETWLRYDAITHTYFEFLKQQAQNASDLTDDDERETAETAMTAQTQNFEGLIRDSPFYDTAGDAPWDPSNPGSWDFTYSAEAKAQLDTMDPAEVKEFQEMMGKDLPEADTFDKGADTGVDSNAAMSAAMREAKETAGKATPGDTIGPDADDGEDTDDDGEAPSAVDQSLINLDYQAGYYDPNYSSGQGSGTSWHSSLGVSRLDVIAAVFKAGLEQRLNAMPKVGSTRGMAF